MATTADKPVGIGGAALPIRPDPRSWRPSEALHGRHRNRSCDRTAPSKAAALTTGVHRGPHPTAESAVRRASQGDPEQSLHTYS